MNTTSSWVVLRFPLERSGGRGRMGEALAGNASEESKSADHQKPNRTNKRELNDSDQ